MTPEYTAGQEQHAAGIALEANPFEAGSTEAEDWANGWQDAATAHAAAADAAAAATGDESPGAPGTDAPEGTPNAEGSEITEEPPAAVEVVNALGDAGYDRIMELLGDPPLGPDDEIVPGLPPEGEVPDDLSEWLEAWKQPLAFVAVDTAIGAVRHKLGGSDKGRLKELYAGMAPMAMVAAMNANAEAVSRFADERVAEAGLIASMQAKVTQKAAGYLLSALLLV